MQRLVVKTSQCVLLVGILKEMHQGQRLNIKFGFRQTGKESQNFFEIGRQKPWKINF